MKKDVKINKKLLAVCVAIFAFLLILCIALVLFFRKDPNSDNQNNEIRYYVADYEEDIFENKAYMSFQRGLLYSSGGVDQLFDYEVNAQEASPECLFFLEYFQSLICGKYESIANFYVDGYFKEQPKFTMQMIYEPYVMYHSVSTEEIDGQEVELFNFHVRYKIFRNNGTFREGVGSNVAIPQIYQLVKLQDGSLRIYRILDVKNES